MVAVQEQNQIRRIMMKVTIETIIPSGWTGVGLTFVYGLAMGFLLEYGGGSLLPIVAHTIADYFIFAVIAR